MSLMSLAFAPRVRDLLLRLGIPGAAEVDGAASLAAAGLVDSFRMLELLEGLEAEFGMAIENREVLPENLDSVDGIAAFVGRKLGG
jgi:acyl carrier protein